MMNESDSNAPHVFYKSIVEDDVDVEAITIETADNGLYRFYDRNEDEEWKRGMHVFVFNKVERIEE